VNATDKVLLRSERIIEITAHWPQ